MSQRPVPPHPADELARLRARIARLRIREAALQRRLLAMPPDARQGRRHRATPDLRDRVEVRADRLPPELRDDPDLVVRRRITMLRLDPVDDAPVASGTATAADPFGLLGDGRRRLRRTRSGDERVEQRPDGGGVSGLRTDHHLQRDRLGGPLTLAGHTAPDVTGIV